MTSINGAREILTSPDAAVINSVAEACGEISEEKGFHNDWKHAESENAAMNVVATKLMLTVSELSEALEEMRDHGIGKDGRYQGRFGEELADAVIRIFDLASMMRIPIGDEVIRKMLRNADRPHLHDRRF
jgi:NTP pyrophosphatase (non-canonical NTP hydrolase)